LSAEKREVMIQFGVSRWCNNVFTFIGDALQAHDTWFSMVSGMLRLYNFYCAVILV
jgi:hypothetical protein